MKQQIEKKLEDLRAQRDTLSANLEKTDKQIGALRQQQQMLGANFNSTVGAIEVLESLLKDPTETEPPPPTKLPPSPPQA